MKNFNLLIKLSLIMTFFFWITSCQGFEDENRPTETASDAYLTATTIQQKMTLFSNFDEDYERGFTREGLVNSNNVNAFFDFDKGEITNSVSADVYLDVSCGTECFNTLIEINNAKSARYGDFEPGFDNCKRLLMKEDNLPASVVPSKYSCFQTNQGNFVQLLILDNEPFSQESKLVFEYTIWYQGNR